MKKPVIFCIVGESASGKSTIAQYITKKFNIELIRSYTTRPMRPKEIEADKRGETQDHQFIDNLEFDMIDPEDMIAYTKFGEHRYCCVKKDINDANLYVIDEDGMYMLKEKHSDDFDIVSVRIHCRRDIRRKRAKRDNPETYKERLSRDEGRYNMSFDDFDHLIVTNQYAHLVGRAIDEMIIKELIKRDRRGIHINTEIQFDKNGISVR